MKKSRQVNVDTRGVAIYARKSRITNKGDSIGVQFKQCADCAKRELHLEDDYPFMEYEDKGLSGYFQTDRIIKGCCGMCRMGKSEQSSVIN